MLEFTTRVNQKLRVTNYQMEVLMGCLLGDAYIHKLGKIQIEHSVKQLPYINWKYKQLKNLSYGKPKIVSRFDNRYKKSYQSSRFWTRQYFRSLRDKFYPEGKKIFPEEFSKYFTPLSLAVWYMDDGNLYKGLNVKFAADGFDKKSRILLRNLLFNKFGLKSEINESGKIRLSNKSVKRFIDIVKPHIHPDMIYKIS